MMRDQEENPDENPERIPGHPSHPEIVPYTPVPDLTPNRPPEIQPFPEKAEPEYPPHEPSPEIEPEPSPQIYPGENPPEIDSSIPELNFDSM